VTGRHSFDVTAQLTPKMQTRPVPPGATLPPTSAFSLTLDADARLIIAGGGGTSQAVPVTTDDGRTFRGSKLIYVRNVGLGCQSGISGFEYDSIEVTLDGAVLRGQADGKASFISGDVSFDLPFSAELEGTADATRPFLVAPDFTLSYPFDMLEAWASEPVPAGATARLVATDGSHVDLVPSFDPDDAELLKYFEKPRTVLHLGVSYELPSDGLVDFAGLAGEADPPLRVGAIPTPPLVPEDGFESAVGPYVGDAAVVRGAMLPPIAGTTSVYVAGQGAPMSDGVKFGKPLFVRLPRHAGDTKVRFSYRLVSLTYPLSFVTSVKAGSVDGPIAEAPPVAAITDGPPPAPGGPVIGPVQEMELALADSVEGEVVVWIQPLVVTCGFAPPGTGMLIDDLRAE
jgi:hypothetical protein